MSVEQSILRRAYTRSVAKDLRHVTVLELSFTDVVQQWQKVLCTLDNSSGTDDAAARHALTMAARLTSQLKAVKQELLIHLNGERQAASSAAAASALNSSANSRVGCYPTVYGPVVEGMGGSIYAIANSAEDSEALAFLDAVSGGPRSMRSSRAAALARRVLVWSVLLGIALADMDVLSSSLAVAQHEVAAEADGGSVVESELVSFFYLQSPSSPAFSVNGRGSFSLDVLFIAAAVVLYNTLVADAAAASRALCQWCELTESLAAGCVAATNTESEAPQVKNTDFSISGSELSRTQIVVMLRTAVSHIAASLAADDFIAAARILQGLWNVRTEEQADRSVIRPLRAFLLGLQLLLRMLAELEVRRSLLKTEVGKTYRPVIVPAEHAVASVGKGGAAEPTEVTLASCIAADGYDEAECKTNSTSAQGSHEEIWRWPRRIQLDRLKDVGGPWPLPRSVVDSVFTMRVDLS